MAAPTWPFEGLPLGWELLLTVCLAIVAAMFAWSALLFVRGRAAALRPPQPPPEGADAFSWVFLVPALNEEVTIADSVRRLLAVPVARRRIIVDADGRLHPDAPAHVAAHFADPRVGGVQALVRIYNRRHPLTWLQDVEFSVYGNLFQAGRDHWGTAGMGGNGQFNRLSTLDQLAAEGEGPWRHRLTEDQDLGLRLIAAGWEGRQELRATVDQQGLSRLGPLLRQRTRWSQGNLQAISLCRDILRAPLGLGPRLEQVAYLLMPFWQGVIGAGLLGGLVIWLTGTAGFWGDGPFWQLGFFYLLAYGGTMLGCVAARAGRGPLGWLRGLLIAQVYVPYTWLLWPVLLRSTARQLAARGEWAKTEREPLGGATAAAGRP